MRRHQHLLDATLPDVLAHSCSAFSEWLNARVEEATATYSTHKEQLPPEITSLRQLEDPKNIAATLSSIDWAFKEAVTTYLSHDIHPYPAKFIPQIPAHLITQLSLRGELVWDPFGGSGTTALEAVLLGRRCVSSDANPLAEVIGKAKITTLAREDEVELLNFCQNLSLLSDERSLFQNIRRDRGEGVNHQVPDIPNIHKWFGSHAVDDLSFLRTRLERLNSESSRAVARVAFSRTILKVSNQDSETRYSSRPREIHSGFTFKCFVADLTFVISKVRLLGPLLRFRKATFLTLDLRDTTITQRHDGTRTPLVSPNSVDLIVTSPPYPNANDYHLYHRFRLFWLGHNPQNLARVEIGSHLRHQREGTGFSDYTEDMRPCITNCFQALRPGRYAAFVVGNALFGGKLFDTANAIRDLALELGFELVTTIDRPVHATRRSFISPARRTRSETLLVVRKPPRRVTVSLVGTPYKLWEYEKTLLYKEISRLTGKPPIKARYPKIEFPVSCYELDKLRRLTFVHHVVSKHSGAFPTWQAILENGGASVNPSRRKDSKYATHGIHPYKGKFYPQLAKSLLNLAGIQRGDIVLDPFCGSGTVILEGCLSGVRPYGCDLNPLATKIAQAKTDILDADLFVADWIFARLLEGLKKGPVDDKWFSYFPADCRDEIERWFAKPVANKLGWLLSEVRQLPDPRIRTLLEVLVSSIIRRVSQQDPRDLRIRRRQKPLKDAPVFEIFSTVLSEQRSRLLDFALRAQWSPHAFQKATVWLGDARSPDTFTTVGLEPGSVGAVITSPPYATALPYIDTDRLSILTVLGMPSTERRPIEESLTGSREISNSGRAKIDEFIESRQFQGIPSPMAQRLISTIHRLNAGADVGFRRKNLAALLYRYFSDMTAVLATLHPLLRKKGRAFFVVGDNRTTAGGHQILINTTAALAETAQTLGWKLREEIPITVTTENLRHIKHAITQNTILCLER